MIKTEKELFESKSVSVLIERELAKKLLKSTNNSKLRERLSKDGWRVIISKTLREELRTTLENRRRGASISREKRLSKGGRPPIEVTEYQKSIMTEKERRKMKYRIWKRESRERLRRQRGYSDIRQNKEERS